MDKWFGYFLEILKDLNIGLRAYIKAQLKLGLISFGILLVGLGLIKTPYFGIVAFLLALIDIIPLIGSGIVMIPWSLVSLIRGREDLAIRLGLIYLILIITRQVLEPIIVGKSIGLRPIYTFAISLIGGMILGPIGFIVSPIIGIVINSIFLKGKIDDIKK